MHINIGILAPRNRFHQTLRLRTVCLTTSNPKPHPAQYCNIHLSTLSELKESELQEPFKLNCNQEEADLISDQ